MGMKKVLLVAAAFVLLGGLSTDGYSIAGARTNGLPGAALVLGAFLGGTLLGPTLLPWLPGRAFSVKGAALGLVLALALVFFGWPWLFGSWLHTAAWILIIPAITSFLVMNFTGASTFTSLSGVLRELRFALPIQATAAVVGVGLWVAGLFLQGRSSP